MSNRTTNGTGEGRSRQLPQTLEMQKILKELLAASPKPPKLPSGGVSDGGFEFPWDGAWRAGVVLAVAGMVCFIGWMMVTQINFPAPHRDEVALAA